MDCLSGGQKTLKNEAKSGSNLLKSDGSRGSQEGGLDRITGG
jgi:hypothetical protein